MRTESFTKSTEAAAGRLPLEDNYVKNSPVSYRICVAVYFISAGIMFFIWYNSGHGKKPYYDHFYNYFSLFLSVGFRRVWITTAIIGVVCCIFLYLVARGVAVFDNSNSHSIK